ncbi:MAG: type II secretion system protein J [Novosphingobium sp.]
MREPRSDERGFLLVEALFSFAIVAMMSALVYVTVAQASHAATTLVERRSALLLARSVLAAATVNSQSRAISPTGVEGDLVWSISAEGYQGAEVEAIPLRKVTVTVTDRSGRKRLARLSTLGTGH